MLAGGFIPRMTTTPFPRHGVTVQNGPELIALSAVKPLEPSLRDGDYGVSLIRELKTHGFSIVPLGQETGDRRFRVGFAYLTLCIKIRALPWASMGEWTRKCLITYP